MDKIGPVEAPVVVDPPLRRADRHAQQPKAVGRAGRDLRAAVGVGVALAVLVVVGLFVLPEIFVGILCVALVIAVWELRQALAERSIHAPLVPVAIGAVSMAIAGYVRGPEALVVATTLSLVAVLVWRVADGLDGALTDVSAGAFTLLYPCFLAGFAALMVAEPEGQWRVLAFILITVFSDIGGYAFGVLLGKHPMAPKLSPKKSWEGFAGSVLTCAVVGAISIPLIFDSGQWWHGALLGMVIAPVATIGDLVESSIKRDLGVKDMSNILPGHGGLMDRLDSLVLVAPVVWAALRLISPVTG
ncbi:phosphatidate cytidylyltransferase [Janibacter sp. YIM B02568]|uniref:phosphatidate cytidylyltransferase n=1 Tax=Janibacter endophyticus TaxID=2806261 RepID=UPI0019523770|nr:phosphatidate cytidylyltransferase [Janibacter endophyticus]MBM6545943.1 phosphatidate cytidylyltransferase [Janibacter endophyticus]